MLSYMRQRDRFSFTGSCILQGFELYLYFNPGGMSKQTFFRLLLVIPFARIYHWNSFFYFFFQLGASDEIAPF